MLFANSFNKRNFCYNHFQKLWLSHPVINIFTTLTLISKVNHSRSKFIGTRRLLQQPKKSFIHIHSYRTPQKDKLWDSFQDPPPPQTGGSAVDTKRFESFKQILKLFTFIFVFIVILCAGVLAKSTFLLMATHTRSDSRVKYCNIRCKMTSRRIFFG